MGHGAVPPFRAGEVLVGGVVGLVERSSRHERSEGYESDTVVGVV